MIGEKKYRYLEHRTDVYIAAYGRNLPNAFENVAKAMFNVMTEVEKIFPDIRQHLNLDFLHIANCEV